MSRLICLLGLVAASLSVAGLVGCGQSGSGINPELLAKHRARLTLAEEPGGALVVPEVRDALLGVSDDSSEHDHGEHDHGESDDDHSDHEHGEGDHDEGEHKDHEEDGEHAEHENEEHGEEEHESDAGEEEGELEHQEDDDDGDEEHADHDEEGHEEHADHDEEGHDEDADHDHGEEGHDEDADHDREEGEHDEHADHDHEENGHDEHADHDHEGHNHEGHEHGETAAIQATEPMEVVLVGQIGGLTNPWKETQPDFPFARGQAAFFLADPLTVVENEDSGHNHAPGEECAFCEAHAVDRSSMLAMVRFLDENGDVLPMEVRDLFDVKERDTVVVKGTARLIAGGMMVVDANGIYVRQ